MDKDGWETQDEMEAKPKNCLLVTITHEMLEALPACSPVEILPAPGAGKRYVLMEDFDGNTVHVHIEDAPRPN